MKPEAFVFGCGHREPACWYPELLAVAGGAEACAENEQMLPAAIICAWCCSEDESRLELQSWLLRSGDRVRQAVAMPRQMPDSEAERRQLLPRWLAYQRRMESRGAAGPPALR